MEKLDFDVLFQCNENISLTSLDKAITKSLYWSSQIICCLGVSKPVYRWPFTPKTFVSSILKSCKSCEPDENLTTTDWRRASSIANSYLSSRINCKVCWPYTYYIGLVECFVIDWVDDLTFIWVAYVGLQLVLPTALRLGRGLHSHANGWVTFLLAREERF